MAAKSNDIADKVLNIGIVVAVIAGLWFLFKYLKNALGGGDTLFGGANSPSSGSGNQPGIDLELKHLGDRIAAAVNKNIINPTKATRMAIELEVANKAALKYWNKAGTNIVINKTLKAVNALPDNEFLDAVNKWLKIENKDFYDTTLVGAQIYTMNHSNFLLRYQALTGKVNYSPKEKEALKAAYTIGTHLGI